MTNPPPFDSLRTAELLPHVRNGNHDAWREMYRRYRTFLRIAASDATGQLLEDADDVLQSAFLSAWKEIKHFSYRGEGSLRAWLRRIVVNKNLDKLRSIQRRKTTRQQSTLETGWMDSIQDANNKGPAASAEEQDGQLRLFQCIETELSPIEREIITLLCFEQLSTPQVAEIVELGEETVRRQYKTIMEKIARYMEKGELTE